MGKSGGKGDQFCTFEGAKLAERAGAFLRRRHPAKTAIEAAATIGAPIDTVENWLRGGAPSGRWLVVMVGVYGPQFLNAVCPGLDWLDEAAIAAERAEIEAEMQALRDRRARLLGEDDDAAGLER